VERTLSAAKAMRRSDVACVGKRGRKEQRGGGWNRKGKMSWGQERYTYLSRGGGVETVTPAKKEKKAKGLPGKRGVRCGGGATGPSRIDPLRRTGLRECQFSETINGKECQPVRGGKIYCQARKRVIQQGSLKLFKP